MVSAVYAGLAGSSRNTAGNRPAMEERILDFATLGDALFQEQVSRVISRCHKRATGAVASLDFVTSSGDAYHLTRQTPGPDAIAIDDTDQLSCAYPNVDCDEADYVKVSFPFKTYWVCGDVTRRAIVRGRGFADILAIEMADMTERLLYTLEKQTFQGNFDGASPKEFEGLFPLIEDYNGALGGSNPVQVLLGDGCVLDVTPGSTTDGDLTLTLLDQVLDELKTGPAVLYVSKAGRRLIRSLLQAQQRFNDTAKVRAGFEVEAYFDAPIITTDGVPDTLRIIDDGSGNAEVESLTAGASTAVVAANTDEVFYAEWTPATIEPIAKCTSERQQMQGYWDGTLVLNCPEGAAMILCIDPNP